MARKRDKDGHFLPVDPKKQLEVTQTRTASGQFSSATTSKKRQLLEAELNLLVKHNGGIITAEQVVQQAEKPDSALHGYFTWDDGEAAAKWRLTEARQLITAIRITTEDRQINVRALTSLDMDRYKGGGYRFMEDVMASPTLREHLLQTALRELKALEGRYQHLQEFDQIWGAIDSVSTDEAGKSLDSTQQES